MGLPYLMLSEAHLFVDPSAFIQYPWIEHKYTKTALPTTAVNITILHKLLLFIKTIEPF